MTQTEFVSNFFPLYVLIVNPLAVAFILWLPTYYKTSLVAMSQFICSIGLATMFCRYAGLNCTDIYHHVTDRDDACNCRSSVFFLMDRSDRLFVNVLTWLSWMASCVAAVAISVYRERGTLLYHILYYM